VSFTRVKAIELAPDSGASMLVGMVSSFDTATRIADGIGPTIDRGFVDSSLGSYERY
jgi:hypothetical protein